MGGAPPPRQGEFPPGSPRLLVAHLLPPLRKPTVRVEELVLIYALMEEEEVDVMRTMVGAAARWCSGGEVGGD